MRGIDRADQNIAQHRITMGSKKWWWALFAFLIDASVNMIVASYDSSKNSILLRS